jgi:hypothetical protein
MKHVYTFILLSICIIILYYRYKTIENFEDKTEPEVKPDENTYFVLDDEMRFFKEINRKEFNTLFSTNIVSLPKALHGIGIMDGDVYLIDSDDKSLNFYQLRAFVSYFIKYIYPSLNTKKIYFLYSTNDGYGEYIDIINKINYYEADEYEYKNSEDIKSINNLVPLFYSKKYVLTPSKRKHDIYAKSIPDAYFILSSGYRDLIEQMEDIRIEIPWTDKKQIAVWRGNVGNGSKYNFIIPMHDKNQRHIFVEKYNNNEFRNVNYSSDKMPKELMCEYKYLLDIDGWSNTWDATIWKLLSGCVLLKVNGVWEQWYYNRLKEWVHYVPISDDFSDLNDKIEWCINHDERCKEISKAAYEFVLSELTFEKTQEYTIRMFNDFIV